MQNEMLRKQKKLSNLNLNEKAGHLFALFTIIVWGVTFVSTKILLRTFSALEILFLRFFVAYIALLAFNHHRTKALGWKTELTFFFAGLSGIFGYYLLENVSLIYTSASNVGVIVSSAPLFTAICAKAAHEKGAKTSAFFYIGFVIAMAGIVIISINGSFTLNSKGDLLALVAAAVWGIYAVLSKRLSSLGLNLIEVTRRTFFYGVLLISIVLFSSGSIDISSSDFTAVNIFNILFLSLGASALCFVTWNAAVSVLGSIKTSVYIYLNPVVTIIFSAIILSESITVRLAIGSALILTGLFVSQKEKSA